MARTKILEDRAPDSGSDKTAVCVTETVVNQETLRGSIRRSVDCLVGWSFILSWIVVAVFGEPREFHIPDHEDE